jgi:hypothetical protein
MNASNLTLSCFFTVALFLLAQPSNAQVVVIPLGSDSRCEVRTTPLENLSVIVSPSQRGYFKNITANCLEGEKAISGGFRSGSWDTDLHCRVISSHPSDSQTSWVVIWAMSEVNECAASEAQTYAICCK